MSLGDMPLKDNATPEEERSYWLTMINELTADRDRLRRALQEILNYSRTGYVNREIARTALGGAKE
jgi:hypothetical protein